MTAVKVLADWWRHLTYRDIARPHPRAGDALRQMSQRTPQTYDPWAGDGRPS